MPAMSRRGVTLIEVLVALVMGTVIAMAVYQALIVMQRTSNVGMQRIDVQQNLRGGLGYVSTMLRELDAGEGDITVATPIRLTFRSMRWVGILCAPVTAGPGGSVNLPIRRTLVFGQRAPDAVEDSVLLFGEGDPSTRTDDTWLLGGVRGAVPGVCSDGIAAILVTVRIAAGSGGRGAALAGVTPGAPLRGFQQEELSLFAGVDGRWWMGQRLANRSATWTPVRAIAGPVSATGLAFAYYDSTDAATATLTDIASVAVSLHAESPYLIRRGGTSDYARDSLLTRVALRNNPRF